MSTEQLQLMLDGLQTSQNRAIEALQNEQNQANLRNQKAAADAAAFAQTVLVDAMNKILADNKPQPQPSPPRSEPTEKEKEATLDRKSDIKLNEKSYKRMDRLGGGDDEWEDWRYDSEIITRSISKPRRRKRANRVLQ